MNAHRWRNILSLPCHEWTVGNQLEGSLKFLMIRICLAWTEMLQALQKYSYDIVLSASGNTNPS